jgi:hypothetical protein
MRVAVVVVAISACVVSAAAADFAGTYKGTWAGGQAGGDLTMTLRAADDGTPQAQVSFTLGGQDIKCSVTSVKVDGSKIEVVYDFDLGDVKLQSTATGQLSGKALEGTYKTKSLADGSAVDEGTFKASAG